MQNPNWSGVFPAITTQFEKDGRLNLDGTAEHCEVLIKSGIAGLVMCGSLGENQTMLPHEKLSVVQTAVETAAGRIPVLTGVAETSTSSAVKYVQDCEKIGVNGFMVMPPMVYKALPEEATHYFRTVAASTGLPWMMYNNPIGYTVDTTPEQMKEYSDIKNLVAIKESSANTRRITELRLTVGNRYQIFVGVDDIALEAAILGIDGWVAGSGIAFPEENQHLWELTQESKWDEARELFHWFYPLLKLDTHIKFVQYIKLLVQEVGLGKEWVREPRLSLKGEERDRILKIIHTGIDARPQLAGSK